MKVLFFLLFFFPGVIFAQNSDSLKTTDTLYLYKKIKKSAYRHKFTTLLYHAIFVDPAPVKPLKQNQKPRNDDAHTDDPNLKYNGRFIQYVSITVYDPFGYSVNDTTMKTTNPFQKLGNKYHKTTREWVIRNLLLFSENDTIDLLKINESERLLRGTPYINDARIYISPGTHPDSAGISVVVHDKWTVDAPLSGGLTGGHITLRERNFSGLGQTFEQYLGYHFPSHEYQFSGKFRLNNIQRTYISSEIFYSTTRDATQAGIGFDRPFYSALAKWAGGLFVTQTWGTHIYVDSGEIMEKRTPLDQFYFDTWIAKSYQPNSGKTKNRRVSNIVIAARYAGTKYQRRPGYELDSNRVFSNNSLYLGSVGFSLAKYYKDRYIFRFGANEDVPEGVIVQFSFGLLEKEFLKLGYYSGIELSKGKHFKNMGYFSASANYGTFYNRQLPHNSTLNIALTYFSDLLIKRNWFFRQFVYFKYIQGFNKPIYERITLRPEEMYGFNNGLLLGTQKVLLNLETVAYAPYNFFGFRFAPLLLAGFGVLNRDNHNIARSPLYQSYALGMLIRNENLLTSSFEITFGAYPHPGDGSNQFFRFNPVTSFTLKVRGFSIGKPGTVAFE